MRHYILFHDIRLSLQVRFSHLRKVQDTLVKDLEHCIMRRESLLDEADAREKRSVTNFGSVSNRIVFERKLENLSNRTKQAKMASLFNFLVI